MADLARYWAGSPSAGKGAGGAAFGESYVQEALAKREAVASLLPGLPLEWHFIGHVQTNKAREVAGNFTLVHSVDSVRLGEALQRAWKVKTDLTPLSLEQEPFPSQAVLVQVNIGREEQKSGVRPEEAEALLKALAAMPALCVQGLMCLPPDVPEAEDARPYFRALRQLRDSLCERTGLDLPHLSMGMSHDFEQAVEEGATLVRVGTDIFGPRA